MSTKSNEKDLKKSYSEGIKIIYVLCFQNEFSPDKRSMQKSGGGASAGVGLHDPTNPVLGETAVGAAGMLHARRNQKFEFFRVFFLVNPANFTKLNIKVNNLKPCHDMVLHVTKFPKPCRCMISAESIF